MELGINFVWRELNILLKLATKYYRILLCTEVRA